MKWFAVAASLALALASALVGDRIGEVRARRDAELAFEVGVRTGIALGKGPPAPDLRELLGLLAAHAGHAFDPAERTAGCDEPTLGAFVELLTRRYGGPHQLRGGCGEFPIVDDGSAPRPDPAYWFCMLDAVWNDDSPVHRALYVRVRRADRHVDLSRLACN